MALIEYNIFGEKRDKVQTAIDRLRAFEPKEGYYVADSGGKDSSCVVKLCEMAGVKFDAHYHATTVDPAQLVRFIRRHHPETEIEKPEHTMRELIIKNQMPPTRLMRYCCQHLKELHGQGRVVVTGVRWAESGNRKKNQGLVTFTTVTRELHNAVDLSGAEPSVGRAKEELSSTQTTTRTAEWLRCAIGRTKRLSIRLLTGRAKTCGSSYGSTTYRIVSCTISDSSGLAAWPVRWAALQACRGRLSFSRSSRNFTSTLLTRCWTRGEKQGSPSIDIGRTANRSYAGGSEKAERAKMSCSLGFLTKRRK